MATLNQLVDAYVKVRDKKTAIQQRHKEELAQYNDLLDKLETRLLEQLNKAGGESIRTDSGTAYKKVVQSATVGNWDEFLRFVKNTGSEHLLERRCAKLAVLEYVKEHNDVPPGINLYQEITVGVNRPKTTKETCK